MKVKILKGTNQIGGCITEVTSNRGTKIIIDLGEILPLDINEKFKNINPDIDGLTVGVKKYDAVFITHSHIDHIGLINHILDDIDVYVEKEAKKIYKISSSFNNKKIRKTTKDILIEEQIIINNDIKITPYIADHSAYNSLMFLIEADNKKILHTGDFRSHGYKGHLLENTLNKIKKVDMIITEGTSLEKNILNYKTEEEMSKQAKDIFNKYDQVFIYQSSTNIDRIISFYNAIKETNKILVYDCLTTNIVLSLDDKIPNPKTTKGVYTIIPKIYKLRNLLFKLRYIYPLKKYVNKNAFNNKYALLVKSNMLLDIKELYRKNKIKNACLIFSMSESYKERKDIKYFLEKIKDYNINNIITLHTSGHADRNTLKMLNKLKASKVIPIHTRNKEEMIGILDNVYLAEENEVIEV